MCVYPGGEVLNSKKTTTIVIILSICRSYTRSIREPSTRISGRHLHFIYCKLNAVEESFLFQFVRYLFCRQLDDCSIASWYEVRVYVSSFESRLMAGFSVPFWKLFYSIHLSAKNIFHITYEHISEHRNSVVGGKVLGKCWDYVENKILYIFHIVKFLIPEIEIRKATIWRDGKWETEAGENEEKLRKRPRKVARRQT